MADKTYRVEVETDFMQKLSRVTPASALAELIWNSLDADAIAVEVTLDDAVLGAEKIVVRDDGTGFKYDDPPILFRKLGGSWKRLRRITFRHGRFVHGAEGQGRLKALALGRVANWHVVYKVDEGQFEEFDIWVTADDPSHVRISERRIVESARPGVTVTITELASGATAIASEGTAQSMCETFAIYLRNYPNVRISLPTGSIDPSAAIVTRQQVELPSVRYADTDYPANLELVAWKVQTERFLYFCDERGLSLARTHLRVHAPGLNVSAHLKSALVSKLSQDGVLGVEELHPALTETLERVGSEVRTFHRERMAEDARSLVDEWKSTEIYP